MHPRRVVEADIGGVTPLILAKAAEESRLEANSIEKIRKIVGSPASSG